MRTHINDMNVYKRYVTQNAKDLSNHFETFITKKQYML